jgi:hypothetical protein
MQTKLTVCADRPCDVLRIALVLEPNVLPLSRRDCACVAARMRVKVDEDTRGPLDPQPRSPHSQFKVSQRSRPRSFIDSLISILTCNDCDAVVSKMLVWGLPPT